MSPNEFEERVHSCNVALSFGSPTKDLNFLRGKNVLDVGCGFGAMAVACQRAGVSKYLGVDPWLFGSRAARLDDKDPGYLLAYERAMPEQDRDNFSFFMGYVENIQGKARFDVAVFMDVLEHIPNPAPIISALYRLLKPKGIVIANTAPHWYSAMGHHLWDSSYGAPWQHFTKDYRPQLGPGVSPFRLDAYETLGKCTVSDIKTRFEAGGFKTLDEMITKDDPEEWEKHKHSLDPDILSRTPEHLFLERWSRFTFRRVSRWTRLKRRYDQ